VWVTAAPTVRVPPGRVLALGGLSALGPLSLDLYLPALPTLTTDLGAGEAAGQLSLSSCMVGLALGQLLTGPLTDRVGRRVPLLVGTVVFALSAGACALAPSIGMLLALRLVGGLAGGAGIVIARAMVRDFYEGPQLARVFALLTLVMGVAPIGAPLLGGLLLTMTSWRGVFAALAALGVVLVFAAATLARPCPPRAAARAACASSAARSGRCWPTAPSCCPRSSGPSASAACSSTSRWRASCSNACTACPRSSSRSCSG
jgi:DHA1 family bicyclomycin/chloramphenicol resistance-like MFS transporter